MFLIKRFLFYVTVRKRLFRFNMPRIFVANLWIILYNKINLIPKPTVPV
jgi:hypothetical protein